MAKIIFHLGTYKTGSTSIQNHLFDNREKLLERGILYPASVANANRSLGHRHSELAYRFNANEDVATPKRLIDEVRDAGAETVILSSEAWSAPRMALHLMRIVNDFKALGYAEAHAVLFLRNVVDYRVSYYRELTTNDTNKTGYERFISRRRGMFDYQFLMRSYRALFGDNVHGFEYGKHDSVKVFRDVVGAEYFNDIPLPAKHFNTKTIDAVDVEIFRVLNQHERDHTCAGEVKARLSRLLGKRAEWTERVDGDHEAYPAFYAEDLAKMLNWSEDRVEALLQDRPHRGRPVADLEPAIIGILSDMDAGVASGATLARRVFRRLMPG